MKRNINSKIVADLNYFADRIEKTFANDWLFKSLLDDEISLENGVLFYKGVDFRQLHLVFKEEEINQIMKKLNKILSKYLDALYQTQSKK
ncbi:hypothetical protein [Hippea alviniae]|uniref:hypothetical protein n=1 Tax=Hippea alviniae TaxID=1279027 RepID=UPI0003B5173F|nr:hypothetical protein [Hippea alviniae]